MSKMVMRAAALMSLLTLLLAGPAVASAEAAGGTGSDDKCMAVAYAMYAACLGSSDTYWGKVLCDLAFELNALSCSKS